MGNREYAIRTLEKFSQRSIQDVHELTNLPPEQTARVRNLAHNMKAVAAHVGAARLRRIAFEIERAADRANIELIEQTLPNLVAEARRCAQYLPEAISSLNGVPGQAFVNRTSGE
jgi:HPt (histidine-containing phosphotransfer) domain-containing protein